MALLSDDGAICLLSATSHSKNFQSLDTWDLNAIANPAVQASQLITTRTSLLSGDDLILIDRANNQLRFLTSDPPKEKTSSRPQITAMSLPRVPTAVLDVDDAPLAVLPMRLNSDALSDLVLLRKGQSAPSVVLTTPTATFTVTTTDINSNSGLPVLLASANANSGSRITFNIPASDPNCNSVTHVCTIRPGGFFPTITANGTTIDGTSQPGYSTSDHPLIEINASGMNPRAAALAGC
jgi:hypothetical protein